MINRIVLFIVLALIVSCRGQISDEPPLHLNPNMDFQSKKKAQRLSREVPQDTVAFGESTDANAETREKYFSEDVGKYTGKNEAGEYLARIPESIDVDYSFVKRGQDRFNIYCAACHDKVGTSRSVIILRGVGIPPPPNLSSPQVLEYPDGEIFEVITYGRRNMSGYGAQIEVEDRWAIIAYVRAIQVSRTKKVADLPEDERYLIFKEE